MSKYILLKDLPNIKAGMIFKPTGCGDYQAEDGSDMWRDIIVENTPEWFKEEEILPKELYIDASKGSKEEIEIFFQLWYKLKPVVINEINKNK